MPVINLSNAGTISRAKKPTTTSKAKVDSLPTDHYPSTPTTKSPNVIRREPPPSGDSDSSEVEILSRPPTPTKKKGASGKRPGPGSPAFAQLPAVSIRNMVAAALRTTRSSPVAFGSTDDEGDTRISEPDHITSVEEGRNKRITKRAPPTEDIQKNDTIKQSPIPAKSRTNKRERSLSRSPQIIELAVRPQRERRKTEKAMYIEKSVITKVSARKSQQSPAKRPRVVTPSESSDEDLPVPSKIMDDVDTSGAPVPSLSEDPKDELNTQSKVPINLFIDAEASEEATSQADHEEESVMMDNDDESTRSAENSSVHESEPTVDVVMDRALQDPDLYVIYDGLPVLAHSCEVHSFGSDNSTYRIGFAALKKGLHASDLERVVKALVFTATSDHGFVNTARADPGLLYADPPEGRTRGLKVQSTNRIAQLVMPGLVVVSNINSVAQGRTSTSSYEVHSITIAPFFQEWLRDTAVWGILLGHDKIAGTVSVDGLQFTTKRPANRDDFPRSQPSSPRKKAASALASTVQMSTSSASSTQWQFSREFDNRVPIYDGRSRHGKAFDFTDAHFRELQSWPLWRDGEYDLPVDSVVAVGYTLNTYTGASSKICLSTNIQYVILLGLPKSYKEEGAKSSSGRRK